MLTDGVNVTHFGRDRMAPITCETVYAGSNNKMCAQFLGETVEFEYIALAVAHVNTSVWSTKAFDRLAKIVQPANALLLLDRNACWVDFALERGGALKLITVPEFHCRKAEWKPINGDRQAGMHQNSTNGVVAQTPLFVASAVDA